MTWSTPEVPLLLQRLAQFVQQPRVLDGDDGLRWGNFSPARSARPEWPHHPTR